MVNVNGIVLVSFADGFTLSFADVVGVVTFRMIVFRPFKGEIIVGKITSGTENGIKSMTCYLVGFVHGSVLTRNVVGVEFYNDILVPPDLLLDGAKL